MPVAYTIQPTYAIDDATLLETDLTTCTLLVMIGSGTFSYAVLAPLQRKFLALKSYSYQPRTVAMADLEMIEQIFDADRLLFTAFKKVLLAFSSAENTLVPREFYQQQLRKDYLQAALPHKTQDAVLADELADMGLVNVFSVDKDMLGFLRKEFSTDDVAHANTALLKAYRQDADHTAPEGIAYAEVQAQQFTLTVFAGGQLLMQHQYAHRGGLDIVYYTVNSLRQLGLSELKSRIKIGGSLTKDSQVFAELSRFLPRIEWVYRPDGFLYIPKMVDMPSHQFFNLYALALCV